MDYLNFYELEEEPFRNDPDPRFYFESAAHRETRVRVMRALEQRKGLCVVVGPPGSGKTTLARQIPKALPEDRFALASIAVAHSTVTGGWLIRRVAKIFGVDSPRRDPIRVLTQIYQRFVAIQREGRHPVLLVDEAQLMRDRRIMEEFRGLLNFEYQGRKLLSVILLGMDSLDRALRSDPAFAQRIDVRVRLAGLGAEEMSAYVEHRLSRVGGKKGTFADDAIGALYLYTRGTPRLVNTLADNALFEAFVGKSPLVDASAVTAAAEQLGLAEQKAEASPAPTEEPILIDPTAPDADDEPDEGGRGVRRSRGGLRAEEEEEEEFEDDEDLDAELDEEIEELLAEEDDETDPGTNGRRAPGPVRVRDHGVPSGPPRTSTRPTPAPGPADEDSVDIDDLFAEIQIDDD